jgi:hypothetical protein
MVSKHTTIKLQPTVSTVGENHEEINFELKIDKKYTMSL